ncbi:hypothetical protein AB0F07_39240 [Streptomyces fructofermentans]|uniref:hypothetical protein n=1 Tax=Streptomyces fructofermentans TaxID=152141 RepID=UPI003406E480
MANRQVTPADVFSLVTGEMRSAHEWLLSSLETVIDVEAGLREVLLRSDHKQQVEGVGEWFDVEAGLASILPTSSARAFRAPSVDSSLHEMDGSTGSDYDSLTRLKLRQNVIVVNYIRGLAIAEEVEDQTKSVAALASKLAKQLTGREGAMNFSEVVETSLHLMQAVEVLPGFPAAGVNESVKMVQRMTLELTAACDSVSDAARTVVTTRCSTRRSRNTPGELTLREAQRMLTNAVEKALEVVYPLLDRCQAVVSAVWLAKRSMSQQVRRKIGLRWTPLGFPAQTAAELRAFLDDFIHADLRAANLAGVDMTGVKWSVQTLWPIDLDVEDLRSRSTEEPTGSGIYIVRSGNAKTRRLVTV